MGPDRHRPDWREVRRQIAAFPGIALVLLIMSLNLDVEEKQKLLEMSDVVTRAEEIGNELSNRIESLRFLAPFRKIGDPSRN